MACAALVLPPAATAQIEEIVVTARKKEESLQDIPISVTAFGEEQLKGLGLQRDNDVADFTVNFNTLPQTGRDFDRPVIRGMAGPASRGEANAGYFIDGIYVSGSIGGATTGAVERVEILRGPQATQFGRATFSGAVNYVTKKPLEEFGGEINTRAGTHDDYLVGGYVSGPIIEDRLSFLLSGNWNKYGGQWPNNLQENQAFAQPGPPLVLLQPGTEPQEADTSRLGSEETTDFLTKLQWNPWEGGQFNFKWGYTKTDDTAFPSLVAMPADPLPTLPDSDPRQGLADEHGGPVGIFNTLNCWLPPAGRYPLPEGTPAPDEEPWWRTSGGSICGKLQATGWENRINIPDFENGVTANNGRYLPPREPGLEKSENRYFAEFSQDLNDWLLTLRGGINTEDYQQGFDLDHTETRTVFGLFHFDFIKDNRDWSSELRLASPRDLPVRGEVGSYYFDRNLTSTQRSLPGPSIYFDATLQQPEFGPRTERDVKNIAFFGAVGWDISDFWTVDVEGRYASEEISYLGGNLCQTEDTYYNFTPRVSLTYKPTDELRFYAQVANGDKPGDVNSEYFRADVRQELCFDALAQTNDVVVKPEEQWTYEVGMKSQWLDQRFQANLAIFYIDWSQQSIFQTVNFATYPFSDPTVDTLVTTVLRNVGDSENIGGELETLFQVTDELTLIANYGYTHAKFKKGFDSNLFDLTGNGDVSGNWIPSAPEHNYVLGAVLSKPVSEETTFTFRADMAYESRRYTGTSNFNYLGDRTLVNLRSGVETGNWTVTAYVRNLLDDDTPIAGLTFVNFGYGPIAPGNDGIYDSNDDIYPNMYSLNPQRGRDYGLEVGYRFGSKAF